MYTLYSEFSASIIGKFETVKEAIKAAVQAKYNIHLTAHKMLVKREDGTIHTIINPYPEGA